jgi:ABC-type nitrate/sulfonate/bicarbonate transport system substrate-binding protein
MKAGRLKRIALLVGLITAIVAPAFAADKVVLGVGIDPSYGQAYIAAKAGIFAKYNLDVDVKLFPTGSAAASSLIPGDINVAMTSIPAGALTHSLAAKAVLIGHMNLLRGYNGAAASANIHTLEELKGKRIGIAKGSTSEFSATQALQRVGISLAQDTTQVFVDPPEMLAGLLRGDLDAFFVWEPWITRAKQAAPDKVNLLKGVEFFTVETAMVMDKTWVDKNFDVAVRFTRAILEAGNFARTNAAEASDVVADYLKLDRALVAQLMPKNDFMVALSDDIIASEHKDIDKLIADGKMKSPFDYGGYVYPKVLNAIDPKLVTIRKPLN